MGRLVVLEYAPILWQPVTQTVEVSPEPIPRGYRIRALNLRYDGGAQAGDSCYAFLGVARGDGSSFVRLDDMSHTNEVIGERVISTLPLDIVSDGSIYPAAYILQATTTASYPIRYVVLCEVE